MLTIVFLLFIGHILAFDMDELVAAVNSNPNATWHAAPNPKFKNMTLEQFRRLNGVISNQNVKKTVAVESNENIEFPESFDAQSAWPMCDTIGHIYDQGHCGSCWAMCAFEVLQDRICIQSNGRLRPHLSGQDLTSCDPRSHGCGGYD